MLNVTRLITKEPLPMLQFLGDGSYYYNYDITKDTKEIENKDEDVYSCVQVRIYGTPNAKDCIKHVIRAYISQEEEFDLINSANKAIYTSDENSEALTKYIEYLDLVSDIKTKVKNDFNNLK